MKILEKLPEENIRNIISFCEITTLFSLRRVNKQCLKLPNVNNKESYITTSIMLPKFLKYIGYGEQDKAEAILKIYPNLALAFGDLTDCSLEAKTYKPRTWKNITAFQYAILALDYQMWTMILKYISIEEAREQIAKIINKATLKDTEGWIIEPGDTDWPQISCSSLIEALDIYVKNYDTWNAEQCKIHWCQEVGGAQLMLPAHMINEYSHPSRSFYPCPKWQGEGEPLLPRTGVSDWINNSGNKLGSNFAWVRAAWISEKIKQLWSDEYPSRADWDLAALIELLKSRTEQAQFLVFKITSSPHNSPRPSCA